MQYVAVESHVLYVNKKHYTLTSWKQSTLLLWFLVLFYQSQIRVCPENKTRRKGN